MLSKTSAEHYNWGQGCDGWHLLKSPDLSVIQERMPPGTSEVRHVHARARQLFFVLSGQAAIEVNGKVEQLGVNQAVEVPPGVPHQMMNQSQADVEFLVISCPPTQGDREQL